MDTQIFIDDLLNRFAGYSFNEKKDGGLYVVQFLNASKGIVQEATRMDLLDCYSNIRENMLGVGAIQFRLTGAQISNLNTVEIEPGITILNTDSDTSVCFDGTDWVSVAGKAVPGE